MEEEERDDNGDIEANEDALFQELLDEDTTQAYRQLAVEEVLGRLIALLLAPPAGQAIDLGAELERLLVIIPDGVLDRLEGKCTGQHMQTSSTALGSLLTVTMMTLPTHRRRNSEYGSV